MTLTDAIPAASLLAARTDLGEDPVAAPVNGL